MSRGGQTVYTEEIADSILDGIAEGKSIKAAAESLGISAPTVYRWLDSNTSFRERYSRAKEDAIEMMVEEMLDIADDANLDAHSRRVMVDTRKWIASKLKPKKYGDRVEMIGAGNVSVTNNTLNVTLAPDEAYRRMLEGPVVDVNAKQIDDGSS